ncbi:hypothetical protein VULLAG_LOCUS4387 [Vulpes lagopus]
MIRVINLCKTVVPKPGITVCIFDKHTWETGTQSKACGRLPRTCWEPLPVDPMLLLNWKLFLAACMCQTSSTSLELPKCYGSEEILELGVELPYHWNAWRLLIQRRQKGPDYEAHAHMQLQKGSDRKQGAVTRETGGKAFVISFLLDEPVFTSKEEVKGRPQEKDSQKLRMFLRSGAQHIYPERELVDCPSAYPTGAKVAGGENLL